MGTTMSEERYKEIENEAWEWWYGLRDECPCCYYDHMTPHIDSPKMLWPNNFDYQARWGE